MDPNQPRTSSPATEDAAGHAAPEAAPTNKERIIIFDTTLRDGEQSPGASLNRAEKLQVARALEQLKVDIIEAGFPIASPDDHDAVKAIAETIGGCTVAGLARSMEKDIQSAASAVKGAKRPRIHVFLATSAIHRQFKLKKAESEILRQAVDAVKYALTFCRDIEFSPEDASRTEPEFLAEVVQAVIEAGATTVNIPDTVGYAMPEQYGATIAMLKRKVPNIGKAIISVHCHNDLGLATANSLAAVVNGARQIECTVNGLGERAGNCALEEIVMALRTRTDYFRGFYTNIDTRKLYPTSRLVSKLTAMPVQRNKAIVGDNAFAHEAGIHQDGVLKERTTYEIMKPSDIGIPDGSRLVLGKHSGRHALGSRLKALGYKVGEKDLDVIFERFKVLCDKKKAVYDADLAALVENQIETAAKEVYQLTMFQVSTGNRGVPTATVELKRDKELLLDAAIGDGPVDALCNAIDRITGLPGEIKTYELRAVSEGREAQGEVTVRVDFGGEVLTGRGLSTDIVEASARAYLNAVCRAAARAGPPVPKIEAQPKGGPPAKP